MNSLCSPCKLLDQTRSIIEHSASALKLCAGEDHLIRTIHVHRELISGLINEKAISPAHPLYLIKQENEHWIELAVQKYSKNLPKRCKGHERSVQEYLGEICSKDAYQELHNYIHPNAATAMQTSLLFEINPLRSYFDTIDLALLATQCFHVANDTFAKLREVDAGAILQLIDVLKRMKATYDDWYCAINQANTPS